IYKRIARLHIRPFINGETTNIIDRLGNHMAERYKSVKQAALQTPEFISFLQTQGRQALNTILDEIADYNNKFKSKLNKTQNKLRLLHDDPELFLKQNELRYILKKPFNEHEIQHIQDTLDSHQDDYEQQIIDTSQFETELQTLIDFNT